MRHCCRGFYVPGVPAGAVFVHSCTSWACVGVVLGHIRVVLGILGHIRVALGMVGSGGGSVRVAPVVPGSHCWMRGVVLYTTDECALLLWRGMCFVL